MPKTRAYYEKANMLAKKVHTSFDKMNNMQYKLNECDLSDEEFTKCRIVFEYLEHCHALDYMMWELHKKS